MRNCFFYVLSAGPIPDHIAFIMDGNRRYAKKHNVNESAGHRIGYRALISMLRYCYELGIKYVTVYAFSIDNFKRGPEEVESLMELLEEKMESLLKQDSIVNQYGVRVHFAGDLNLLNKPVHTAAQRLMESTSVNKKAVLSVCIAYTSTNEIVRAVQNAYEDRSEFGKGKCSLRLVDIERSLDLSVAPDPDIIIRTSGETRMSNFLLWQSARCLLYSPSALWPEIGFWHLVWAVLEFQKMHSYLEKKKKQV
ncbi:uncharacterized protein [Phyllobates terribilis]|uniref:uncharacterized protein n=1 Tax=Phyllobates terribilis TaxID=111132 RepID=UPI003CCAD7C9